jgi:hypothetical protein
MKNWNCLELFTLIISIIAVILAFNAIRSQILIMLHGMLIKNADISNNFIKPGQVEINSEINEVSGIISPLVNCYRIINETQNSYKRYLMCIDKKSLYSLLFLHLKTNIRIWLENCKIEDYNKWNDEINNEIQNQLKLVKFMFKDSFKLNRKTESNPKLK